MRAPLTSLLRPGPSRPVLPGRALWLRPSPRSTPHSVSRQWESAPSGSCCPGARVSTVPKHPGLGQGVHGPDAPGQTPPQTLPHNAPPRGASETPLSKSGCSCLHCPLTLADLFHLYSPGPYCGPWGMKRSQPALKGHRLAGSLTHIFAPGTGLLCWGHFHGCPQYS